MTGLIGIFDRRDHGGCRRSIFRRRPRRAWLLPLALFLLLAASFAGGCGGRYQLGRHSEPPFRSVYVKPISNESFAPQIHALVSGKIADELARDGLVRVASEGEADVTLEVVIRDYSRTIAATRPEDTVIAAKLDLELDALCTLTDNRSGEVYFEDRPVRGASHVYPQDRPLQSEYQSMPIVAGHLARDIRRTVLETW